MNAHQYLWQITLCEAQELAARYPGMGIPPDSLSLLPFRDLLGVMRFLKRRHWQETQDGQI